MNKEFDIAVLLPTRGRTDALDRSVFSIINRAVDVDKIQIIFAIDEDDTVGNTHFVEKIQPWLDDKEVSYTALSLKSLGYERLNQYYNIMSTHADAEWLFVWNDDAIMETTGWDTIIKKYNGQFKVLKVHTHNDHPYSIFPIVPSSWIDLLGQLSKHQMIDAEISQLAYMTDIMEIVEIFVTHDRHDLTGNNLDDTNKKRVTFEGNPTNSWDFHNMSYVLLRHSHCDVIVNHLKSIDQWSDWWDRIKQGKQDPWEKLKINDVNHQMTQFQIKKDPLTNQTVIAK